MRDEDRSVQGMMFQAVHAYLVRCFGQAGPMGIHPGQIPMLRLLEKTDGVSQVEIGKTLGIKPSTVTVSLKRMEKMELVRRVPDEKDQRMQRVYLTAKGKKIYCELKKILKGNEAQMLAGLSETEICLLKRMLEQIGQNLQEMPQDVRLSKILDREERQ